MDGAKRRIFLAAALVITLLVGLAGVAFAGRLSIPQVRVVLPQFSVFVKYENLQGAPLGSLDKKKLTLKVDGTAVDIDAVQATGSSSRGVAYTVLLDVSRSLHKQQFAKIRSDLDRFLNELAQKPGAESKDRVALLTFGDSPKVLTEFTKDMGKVRGLVAGITPTDSKTMLYSALNLALDLNKSNDPNQPDQRAIIVVTDGRDEGSGLKIEDLILKLNSIAVPVYVFGYSNISLEHLSTLRRIPELSGGFYAQASEAKGGLYARVATDLASSFLVTGKSDRSFSGNLHTLQVLYAEEGTQLSAERSSTFLFSEKQESFWTSRWFLVSLAVLAVLGCGGGVYWYLRRRNHEPLPVPEPLPPMREDADMDSGETIMRSSTTTWGQPPRNPVTTMHAPNLELSVLRDGQVVGSYQAHITDQGITIGGGGSDLNLNDRAIATPHSAIQMHDGKFVVVGLNQGSMPLQNGIPVQSRAVLADRDLIEMGTSAVRVRLLNSTD